MEDDNTEAGAGETLSIEQAAAAYAKTMTNEAPQGQSEDLEQDESETTDDELEASDASEEDDGETEDEGQAEDETAEEPDSDQGRFVANNGKVKLPDGTVSTVADLVAGNLRQRDYTQKTMELAEQRRSAETQSSGLKQLETQLAQEREFVLQLLSARMPQEPDLSLTDPKSPNFDPITYQHQKAQYEVTMRELGGLRQQMDQNAERQRSESESDRAKKSAAEFEALVEAVPVLRDQSKLASFFTDVKEHGAKYGFSMQELVDGIGYDHRMAMVMRDAIAYRKLQASKPKVQAKVENRPPVQKGGKRLNPAEHRARSANDAFTRLKQSGSVEDAAAAYLASRKG